MIPLGTLHIEIGTMLVQLVAFLILMWLLGKYALKPTMKVMDKRQEYIQTQISSAEEANKEAARLVEEQGRVLAAARQESHDILERAKQQKEREGELIIKAAQENVERLMKEARAEIENEKNKAVAALRSQVSAMSVMIASKIIEKQVDEKSQKELIEQYLNQVGGSL